jgi:hypothetical protein
MWYICFAQQNAKSMVISGWKHNYKIVLLCKGELCASISIEEIVCQKGFQDLKDFFNFGDTKFVISIIVFKLDVSVLLLLLQLQTLYAENKIPRKT